MFLNPSHKNSERHSKKNGMHKMSFTKNGSKAKPTITKANDHIHKPLILAMAMLKSIVVRSISFCFENGNLACSVDLWVAILDLTFKWFVIFLCVRVEIFDFKEVHFEYIFVKPELALNERHQ